MTKIDFTHSNGYTLKNNDRCLFFHKFTPPMMYWYRFKNCYDEIIIEKLFIKKGEKIVWIPAGLKKLRILQIFTLIPGTDDDYISTNYKNVQEILRTNTKLKKGCVLEFS